MRKDSAQNIDRHLFTFQWLAVGNLKELIYDIGVAVSYGIGQHVIDGHAKPVDKLHKRIQCEAPFAPFDSSHISIDRMGCI